MANDYNNNRGSMTPPDPYKFSSTEEVSRKAASRSAATGARRTTGTAAGTTRRTTSAGTTRRPSGSSYSAGRTSSTRTGARSYESAGRSYSDTTSAYSRRNTTRRATDDLEFDYSETPRRSAANRGRTTAAASASRASRTRDDYEESYETPTSRRGGSGGNGGGRPPRDGGDGGNRDYKAEIRKKNKTYSLVMVICIFAAAIVLVIGIMMFLSRETNILGTPTASKNDGSKSKATEMVKEDPTATPSPTATPTPTPAVVKIAAVGDDLIHTGVYKGGVQSDGSLNYDCLFDDVAPYFADYDLKCINQETVMDGDAEFSSYPSFNSPTEIGDALVKAGFNVVTQATNHAFDMGLDGLLADVNFWKTNYPYETSGVLVTGIYDSAEDQAANHIRVIEVNGISFAIMNYTYSHNWATFSTQAEGHLDMLCAYNADTREIDFNTINPQVIEDIKAAEEMADFTIVFPHWGTEYVAGYTDQQSNFAKQMTEAGCDLIIGTHPHVIEPVEWVQSDNGNRCLCYYSLGNFTSTQDTIERIVGGMAMLEIIKDQNGVYINEDSIKAVPIITHYNSSGWTVTGNYLLKDYTDDMAAQHGLYPRVGTYVTYEKLYAIAEAAFGDYLCLDPTAETTSETTTETTTETTADDAA